MNIRMDKLINGIAAALDAVEGELLGATSNHGKRIAALCAAMGQKYGMSVDEQRVLTTCALLHDNALTEYIKSEFGHSAPDLKLHCEYGERNAALLNLVPDSTGLILYHHERADGLGSYGKKTGQIPAGAELIAIADTIDVMFRLQNVLPEQLSGIHEFVQKNAGSRFSGRAADAFLETLDEKMLTALKDENIIRTAETLVPHWIVNINDGIVMNLADLAIKIIDYKSTFTRRHTAQIAARSWLMADFYGFDDTKKTLIYLAASLHDIGKLTIPSAILEKPGSLTPDEFTIIKSHVYKTWEILKDIDGLEQICLWASNHHERLDGSGYPFGKSARDLDFESRLIACLDIYQAVSEERPYHAERSREDTIAIMNDMAQKNFIDAKIVNDLDFVMKQFDGKDVPPPALPASQL